jgi:hypothetical protein
LKAIVKELNIEFRYEDSLYEEFPSTRNVLNVVKTESIKHSWVSIFGDLRNNQIDVLNLNKILGFVLSITGFFFTDEQ